MYKRIAVVAVTLLFLLTGVVASAACEIACLSVNHSAACCPHVTEHSPGVASLTHTHPCLHLQEETAVVAAAFTQGLATADIHTPLLIAPHPGLVLRAQDASPPGSASRSTFLPPLRI